KDVFILKMPRMIDRGALLSRYSRTSSLDIRTLYEKEFLNNDRRAEDFYRRVFLEYGDESVSELVTVQLGIQNVSNVASQVIEDSRIGLSYLEKSSRYVSYSRKVNGEYLYAHPDRIGLDGHLSSEYVALCDDLFNFYTESLDGARKYYEKKHPIESINFSDTNDQRFIEDLTPEELEVARKSYDSAVRARSLDDARFLLPASTLTNLGISGNGRSFIYLIQRLEAYGLRETTTLADDVYNELKSELPELIDAARNHHGLERTKYLSELQNLYLHKEFMPEISKLVDLVDYDEEKVALARSAGRVNIYFGDGTSQPGGDRNRNDDRVAETLLNLVNLRKNRRDRIPRFFENVNYTFIINTNFGAFRDFHRHRFFSILRGLLTCSGIYDTPEYFSSDEGILTEFNKLMERSRQLYFKIRDSKGKLISQYVVPFAYRYPVIASSNLREITHFIELRSTPQAHFDMRRISMAMLEEIERVHPLLARVVKYADRNEYALGRLRSEQRKEKKMQSLGEKKGHLA
ncbi:MAG: FAD-dependent thymidylate synthase, partial [Thermoplasmataceae archaeon]